MCGIAGFVDRRIEPGLADAVLESMTSAIAHRGPDAGGAFSDPTTGAWLGHRRLAIRDITPSGAQPMVCRCGRYVITYNGEIYNTDSLDVGRRIGHSDTEVLVEAICAWGIESALARVDGMFAFAVLDRDKDKLHLARDPLGIKPLVYGIHDDVLLFASDLRALYPHPAFAGDVEPTAVEQYLRYHYIPAPLTIYRNTWKLPPGTFVTVDLADAVPKIGVEETYWSPRAALENPQPWVNDVDVIDELDRLVRTAVADQLVSDVPVGAFLSSGIDSTVIVAIQQALSHEPVRTFTISAGSGAADEGAASIAAAEALGTDHTVVRVEAADVLARVDMMASMFDEPFAEPSQLALGILAERARADVTVVLTGDGGDEIAGGYGWYEQAATGWRVHQRLPGSIRRATAAGLDRAARLAQPRRQGRATGHRMREALAVDGRRVAGMLRADDAAGFYAALRSEYARSTELVEGVHDAPPSVLTRSSSFPRVDDIRDLAAFLDLRAFLPQHPLTKVDRTTMAVGLEARPPLLDRRIVEFSASLPASVRFRQGQNKWMLRAIGERVLPASLLDRPKLGFVMPVREWVDDPLRTWVRDRVVPVTRSHDLLDGHVVQDILDLHEAGVDMSRVLWSLAVLEDWLHSERDRRHRATLSVTE